MLQIIHKAIGLHDEAKEVGYGGDQYESLGTLLDQNDIKYQHGDGDAHLDAFVKVKPSLAAYLFVEVFLHHRAVKRAKDHVKIGCHHHPVVPPFLLAEEAQQDAHHQQVDD